jgi:type I restriction enzyme R subunit
MGNYAKVLSSRSRMDKVVSDIVFDFSVKPRLSSHTGNAILVASSIYEASVITNYFNKRNLKTDVLLSLLTIHPPKTLPLKIPEPILKQRKSSSTKYIQSC